jgi:cAMP-dependent protein kinase regulator
MSKAHSKKEIGKVITPILEKLVNRLLVLKPQDPIPYMVQYLQDSIGKGAEPLSKKEAEELAKLRKHHSYYTHKLAAKKGHEEDAKMSDEASSNSDDEDYIDELPDVAVQRMSAPARTSVSAEAYGYFLKKKDVETRVIEKSDEVKEKIKKRLLESFMFAHLDKRDLNVVIDAMEEKIFEEGETVIQQGDDGNELFLVGEG